MDAYTVTREHDVTVLTCPRHLVEVTVHGDRATVAVEDQQERVVVCTYPVAEAALYAAAIARELSAHPGDDFLFIN